MAKEINLQEIQEKSQGSWTQGSSTLRYIIITLPKLKDKERNSKAAREKEAVTYKGVPIRLSADFSKETLQESRGWKEVFKDMKARTYIEDYCLQQSYYLDGRADKVLFR